jgi:opacity protein-like surface antigen
MKTNAFLLVLFFSVSVASAQMLELSASLGGFNLSDDTLGTLPDPAGEVTMGGSGFRFTARADLNHGTFFGHEIGYGFTDSKLDFALPGAKTNMGIHHGFYALVAHVTPRSTPIRPFVAGGFGFNRFSTSSELGSSTKWGWNYGAGVKWGLGLLGLRFDYRVYASGKPFNFIDSGSFRIREISGGVSILIL